MVLFPLAVIWLVIVLVWVLRNSRNDIPEERTWHRWPARPRKPRDGSDDRSRARRASTRAR
jgi:hypothetical protein